MSGLAGVLVARIANALLTALRNHVDLNLSREEFRHSKITFSSSSEDLAIMKWLMSYDGPRRYIDAGCFHPVYASNTLLLSKSGWSGINIDMSSARIEKFARMRPNDFNIVAALSNQERDMVKFCYKAGLTDRIGPNGTPELASLHGETPLTKEPVKTKTIDAVATECGFPDGPFGYLNIDCEGHDFDVLKGIDLKQRWPAVITIEARSQRERQELLDYLTEFGYSLEEILFRTLLFAQTDIVALSLDLFDGPASE